MHGIRQLLSDLIKDDLESNSSYSHPRQLVNLKDSKAYLELIACPFDVSGLFACVVSFTPRL
jgi:hypothetical protein